MVEGIINAVIAIAVAIAALFAVQVWVWLSTGEWMSFNVLDIISGIWTTAVKLVWYALRYFFAMIGKLAAAYFLPSWMDETIANYFNFPTYEC